MTKSKNDDIKDSVLSDLLGNHLAQLFLGSQGEPCISLVENGKAKTMILGSNHWRGWLIRYVRANNLSISQYHRDEITEELCALSEEGGRKNVQVRIARTEDSVQIDLNDDSFDVVHISDLQQGFKLGQPEKVFLFRPNKQSSLPKPILGDRDEFIEKFQELMPEFALGHWLLVLTFILKSLNRDRGAFAILLVSGPQGAGKTILSRRIKALIDPSEPPELSPPKNSDDIVIASRNSYLLVYENMSGISPEMADIFCRLATGGGISKRQLYTDHEEVFYKIHRPVIINGIDEPSNRPDFLDRCVVLELKPLAPGQRIAETNLNCDFEANLPLLLGGLYSLLADCLAILPKIHSEINSLPRMTDFALMGIAIEQVLNLKPGLFLDLYERNRFSQIENTFWNDDLCLAIYQNLEKAPGNKIEGTANELMKTLFDKRSGLVGPRKARGFTGWMKRIEPLLKTMGIVVERPPRSAQRRVIIIRSLRPLTKPPGQIKIVRYGNVPRGSDSDFL
ncbi:hypothetical protein [Bdellovibrio sp.]|uniref:hypothetical protein n=1 Tax=Bdellovibrio sp. TaxID=28201 RepID=UPI0039E69A00